MIDFFDENSSQLLSVNYFCKKTPSWMFDKLINPLIPNAPFLYPPDNIRNYGFLMLSGVEKGCIGKKRVNTPLHHANFRNNTSELLLKMAALIIFQKFP